MANISHISGESDSFLSPAEVFALLGMVNMPEQEVMTSAESTRLLDHARSALAYRHAQREIFPPAVFRENCWDILLMCVVGELEGHPPCVKQIRSKLDESSTALLRRIDELEKTGLLRRQRDQADGRRTMLRLTPEGIAAMGRFLNRFTMQED